MKSTVLASNNLRNPSKNYSGKELLILRSWALGMGDLDIQRLMGLGPKAYQKKRYEILTKLDVMNCYAAVNKAFRIRLMVQKEYTTESIKTFALSFAYKKTQYGDTEVTEASKQELWELYDTLVDFERYLETHFFQANLKKKSHRSGIKD